MEGLISDMSSEAYHSFPNTFSSSQLKDALKNIKIFHKKYILKEYEKEENSAFDVGTFFHSSILEPDKLFDDCAVYEGIRRGKEWTAFKEANIGKAIITKSEQVQADLMISAVKESELAQSFLSKGVPEVSCFVKVYVYAGDIYAKGCILTNEGWTRVYSGDFTLAMKNGSCLTLKVRADLLGDDFIFDLKSTTGDCCDDFLISSKISSYSYDLSAALYLDIFSIGTDKNYKDFIFCFASKDVGNTQCYVASKDNIRIGRKKWSNAIKTIVKNMESDWVFKEKLLIIEPSYYERKWLIEEEKIEI